MRLEIPLTSSTFFKLKIVDLFCWNNYYNFVGPITLGFFNNSLIITTHLDNVHFMNIRNYFVDFLKFLCTSTVNMCLMLNLTNHLRMVASAEPIFGMSKQHYFIKKYRSIISPTKFTYINF